MEPIVRVWAQPTYQEFLQTIRHAFARQTRGLRLLAGFNLAMILAAFCMEEVRQEIVHNPFGLAMGVFLPAMAFVVFPILARLAARKRWESAPEVSEPREYRFWDWGFDVEGETSSGSISWRLIVRAETTGSLILLVTAQNVFYILPLKDFSGTGEVNKLLELLEAKVPDCQWRS
jgi:hypothetical protein